ncbi:MAG: hypothetical protein FWE42_03905 [Defluviitaleaceae bacterium]|nr:hypothetical protein [Defluviitaleaceae bacterium]
MPSFFDSNVSIGINRYPYPHSFTDVAGLIQRMDSYGIIKALVYHSIAREDDINAGNKLLLDEIQTHESLYPILLAMPHHTGEFCEPGELAAFMTIHGVRALRLFPQRDWHNFSLSRRNCNELFTTMEKYNVPIFLELDTDDANLGWSEIENICEHHPNLKLVLCGLDYSVDRNLFPLLSQYTNIYLETYRYKVYYGIEEFCAKFGANRLIFGSGMPKFSGAAAVSMINYALISEKEKDMIARGNLESILGEVRL